MNCKFNLRNLTNYPELHFIHTKIVDFFINLLDIQKSSNPEMVKLKLRHKKTKQNKIR